MNSERELLEEGPALTSKRKTGGRPTFMSSWILEKKFPDETSAFDHLTAEEIWSVDPRRCYSTQNGRKVHYRCNRAKNNGTLCSILKCLYFPNNSNEVLLYKTESLHNHDKTSPVGNNKYFRRQAPNGSFRKKFRHPMESCLKFRISKLMDQIVSPKEIMRQLESEGFEVKNREVQIRNYCSSVRRQGNTYKWKFEKKFTEIDEAKIYLKRQKIWNYRFQNHSQLGMTYHYRCKLVPKAGPQCEARKYLKFNKHANEVTLYQTDCPHTHDDIMRTHLNLDTETKWLLKQLHKCDRNTLKKKGFRVLQCVGLQDCLAEPTDYSTSFHEKLFMLQQESYKNFDSQIKEEIVSDDKNFAIPVEVNLYEGNDDNIEKSNQNKKKKKRKRKSQKPVFTSDWIFEKKFPNKQMAKEYLAKDNIWRIDPRRVYTITGGRKVHYRCKRMKKNGPQCAARKCLLYSVDSDEISLYKTNSEHTHYKIEKQYKMPKTLKKKLGRPCKYSRNIITKYESIAEPVKIELPINNSFDPHINNDSNANSMELITGDDSIQYVINYIDDDQITNADDKTHNQVNQIPALPSECKQQITLPTSCPNNSEQSVPETVAAIPLHSENSEPITYHDKNVNQSSTVIDNGNDSPINRFIISRKIEWKLEHIITGKELVSSYLNKQNTWRCKYRSGNSSKIAYYCSTEKCPAQMCLIYEKGPCNEVFVFRNGKHTHDIANETSDLPLPFTRNELLPDNYLNSNMIMKEELIIDDEPMEIIQNEIDTNDSNVNNRDDNTCSTPSSTQKWNFEKKFANIEEANKLILVSNGLWKIKSTTNRKLYYRCTYPREPECPAQICFIIQNGCDEVLYFSGDPHIHIDESKAMLSPLPTDKVVMLDIDKDVSVCESPSTHNICAIPDNNNSRNPTHKLNEFTFKEKFPNLITAREKMNQETDTWCSTCTRRFKNEYRQYYWCNYNNGMGICTSRVFLLGRHDSNEVFYYTSGSHIHEINMNKGQITEILNPAKPTNAVQHNVNLNEGEINKVLNPAKSKQCFAEIIISDDSDKDSLNGDDVENNLDKWVFETKFDDYKTAKHYMINLNLVTFKSNTSKYGVKEYYSCNLVTKDSNHCPPSKYLLYEDLNSYVLMYNMDIQHTNKCSNIIPPLVPIQKRLTNVIDLVDSDENDADNESDVIMLSESDEDDNTTPSQQDILLNAENTWVLEKEFQTAREAVEFLKDKHIWSFKFRTKSREGVKEFYRCNLTKTKGLPCAAAKCLHTNYSLKGTCLYRTEQNHTHDPHTLAAEANRVYESLDNATKNKIKEHVKAGNLPAQILAKLNLDKHLYYSINKMREIMNGKIGLEDSSFIKSIENWLSQITTIPESHDAHYCVDFNVNYSNKSFQCFLSTRRLLKNAVDANLVHVDSGCSFHWEKNPIIIVGTTDLDQKFHIFGITVCSNKYERDYEFMFKAIRKGVQECYKKIFKPECLMFDDNEAIRSAFIKIFGISSKIGTYSNVALSKIIYKMSTCSDAVMKEEIKNDIIKMQKLSTQCLFFKAADLFFQKWRPLCDTKLHDFLNYFKSYWIDRNPNWFQGFREFTPCTNVAIRREIESLRKNYTFKNKLPLQSFRYHIQVEIEQLSRQYVYGNPLKQFVRKPTIPITVYEKAVEWNNLEKQIEIVHRDSEIRYYISAGDDRFINELKLHKYRECNHQTFDEFFDVQFGFWYVRRLRNNITLTCNCPYFLEKFICKHSVGLASVLNIIQFPPSINQIFLNSKNKTEIVNYINSS